MFERLKAILASRPFENAITAIIILNAITLGLETWPAAQEQFGTLFHFVDGAILVIFIIEISLRLMIHRARFFSDPWSIFDFVVVAIALLPSGGALSVLRALRVLRVLRLISFVPSLKRVVGALLEALPGLGSISLLLGLLYYVFAVMATKLYGNEFPEWFGSLGESAYTLFQVMTLESWSMGIVRPVMEAHPYAWIFFVPFIFTTSFTVLNLFIGIIVSAMQSEHEAEAVADRVALHEETESVATEVKALRLEIAELKALIRAQGGQT
ncbi:ion transporter [Cohaesibacter celericrescens]|uniref:Voltage-gated sodium channel n=1 Tax=Cohaesibacter celericrescens TaxID=2067669 RepID=A0A2N5XMR2_9HYPH|nr:ion transporter [Cohaesibacter celericrescens]PLW75772.1 voltage-gated sodium channel [Cohaesibacter celericrescens]